jgi:hypothetical protein
MDFDIEATRTRLALAVNHVIFTDFKEANGDTKDFANEFSLDLGLHQRVGESVEVFLEVANLLGDDISKTTRKTNGVTERESEKLPRSWIVGAKLIF